MSNSTVVSSLFSTILFDDLSFCFHLDVTNGKDKQKIAIYKDGKMISVIEDEQCQKLQHWIKETVNLKWQMSFLNGETSASAQESL